MPDHINLPITLLIWLLTLVVGAVGSLFSICAHLLIGLRRDIGQLSSDVKLAAVKTDNRLETLERHDQRNSDQSQALLSYLQERNHAV